MQNNMWLIDGYELWNEFVKRYCDIDKGRSFKNEYMPIYDVIRLDEIEHGINLIDNATSIDAVEVVRCKYCIYRGTFKCPMTRGEWPDMDEIIEDLSEDDGFCHKGKSWRRG